MGNTVSCCVSPRGSPKLPRQVESLEDYQINTDLSDDTGPYLQHISDREVPDGKFWLVLCLTMYIRGRGVCKHLFKQSDWLLIQ